MSKIMCWLMGNGGTRSLRGLAAALVLLAAFAFTPEAAQAEVLQPATAVPTNVQLTVGPEEIVVTWDYMDDATCVLTSDVNDGFEVQYRRAGEAWRGAYYVSWRRNDPPAGDVSPNNANNGAFEIFKGPSSARAPQTVIIGARQNRDSNYGHEGVVLTAGERYEVRVSAVSEVTGCGASAFSAVVAATPKAADGTGSQPTGITLTFTPSSVGEGEGERTVTATVTWVGGTLPTATNVVLACGANDDSATYGTDLDVTYGGERYSPLSAENCPTLFEFPISPHAVKGAADLSVTLTDDSIAEGNERLTFLAYVALGDSSFSDEAMLTITDNDAVVGAGEAEAVPDEPTITIYHDPNHSAAAVDRYDEAERLLANARPRRLFVVRIVTGTAEVDRLAGVSNSVMPRFFLGDPEEQDWGPSEPGVNNGGLRWLRSVLSASKLVAEDQADQVLSVVAAPNPFNPSTTIRVQLPVGGPAFLTIYNLAGQVVRTLWEGRQVEAGDYAIDWDSRDGQGQPVASGVYLYVLRTKSQVLKNKMVLIR